MREKEAFQVPDGCLQENVVSLHSNNYTVDTRVHKKKALSQVKDVHEDLNLSEILVSAP